MELLDGGGGDEDSTFLEIFGGGGIHISSTEIRQSKLQSSPEKQSETKRAYSEFTILGLLRNQVIFTITVG